MKAVRLNTELTGLFARLVPLMQQQPTLPPVADGSAPPPMQPRTDLAPSTSRSDKDAFCKVWIWWNDGRTSSWPGNHRADQKTVIEGWKRRLSIGGSWHNMGYQLARIYTTDIPGNFENASYTEIKP